MAVRTKEYSPENFETKIKENKVQEFVDGLTKKISDCAVNLFLAEDKNKVIIIACEFKAIALTVGECRAKKNKLVSELKTFFKSPVDVVFYAEGTTQKR